MKRACLALTDLPTEIVKEILVRVAKTDSGHVDIPRMMSTCKDVYEFAEDVDILKAVCLDRLMSCDNLEPFQKCNGLMTRCASKGHPKAMILLAKVILMAGYQISVNIDENKPRDGATTFMNGLFQEMVSGKEIDGSELHLNAVRLFLRACSPSELRKLRPHLDIYFDHYVLFSRVGHEEFFEALDFLCQSVNYEVLYNHWEQRGLVLVPKYAAIVGDTREPWEPRLDDFFFSMQERLKALIELWKRFLYLLPRVREPDVTICNCCFLKFLSDFKLMATKFESHRHTVIASLDAAFPMLRSEWSADGPLL